MRLHIDKKHFSTKPTGMQIGGIKSRMRDAIVDVSIEEIAEAIKNGQTLQPAVTPFSEASRAAGKKGTVDGDFAGQSVFMIDIDNDAEGQMETIESAKALLNTFCVEPAIIYETFSSTPDHPKFRIMVICKDEITDRPERDTIQRGLLTAFPQADQSCINADRIFFGTDKGLALYEPKAINSRENILSFTWNFPKTDSSSEEEKSDVVTDGKIGVGHREQAMFDEATRLITRLGDTPEARERYDEFIREKIEVVEGEADPPQAKADYIYKRCQDHFHKVTEKSPNYRSSEDYERSEFDDDEDEEMPSEEPVTEDKNNPFTKYQYLVAVYRNEHKFIIGVQRLARGGYGNDMLYEYKGGVWIARSESDVKSQLSKRVRKAKVTPDPTQIDKAYKVIMQGGRRVDVDAFNANEDLVCFQNGVYRLSDGAVLEHSPDYLFTIQLRANLPLNEAGEIELKDTPYCDLCLQNFGDEGVQKLLLQIFGGAISNVFIPRFKKGVLMYGVGNSGKSQYKGLAERILGRDNFNNVDLSDLENNRFLSSAFQFVRLGGSNDMSNVKVKEQKIFKMLTGGDNIQAEYKGADSFSFKYKGLLWFLANQLPLFGGDKGNHVYERWIVIPCNNSVPEDKQIKDLQDRMFAERDSFCIKALRSFQSAIANNYTFDIPEECRLANEQYKIENSSVRTFIDECCEKMNPETVTKDQTTGKFWEVLKRWCLDGNYYLPPKADLKRELAQMVGYDQLIQHTRGGNFYPFVVKKEVIDEYFPFGMD